MNARSPICSESSDLMLTGPSLQLKEVTLCFGARALFAPLSLTLAAGQLHMLTGANGSGKSSLLKCLAGLMPHQGEILRHWPGDRAGSVAYIPQLEAFDATLPMTVADYLLASIQPRVFFLRPDPVAQSRLQTLLAQTGLEDKAQRRIGQLSGGERQRLLFARALAQDAALWFLDEPMNGLDQPAQQQIAALILQLRARGCTLVMVHHDRDFVQQHADQELVISPEQPVAVIRHPGAAESTRNTPDTREVRL